MALLKAWINGSASAPSVENRAFQFGDGLFETMLMQNGVIQFWDDHYQRLSDGCKKLKIPCPDKDECLQELDSLDVNQNYVIKLILDRGDGGRGLAMPKKGPANRSLLVYSFQIENSLAVKSLMLSDIMLPRQKQLAGVKHLNRLPYVLATEALSSNPDYDEALLMDDQQRVIECIVNNVFFVYQDTVITPKLDECGVAGIMRQQVLTACQHHQIAIEIRAVHRSELINMQECFITNAVHGLQLVSRIESKKFTHNLSRKIYGWLNG